MGCVLGEAASFGGDGAGRRWRKIRSFRLGAEHALSLACLNRESSADTKRQTQVANFDGGRLDIGRHLNTGNCFRVTAGRGNRVRGICNLANILVGDALDLQHGEGD